MTGQTVVVLTLHGLRTPGPDDWHLLDADERARAGRFAFHRDRDPWVAAHAWMRRELADVVGVDPSALLIDRTRDKPRLAHGPPFNLSHTLTTGALAVCAGSEGDEDLEVGVDVEAVPTTVDRDAAALVLGPRELLACDTGGPEAFARAWTRKEAWVKASGSGLHDGCRSVDLVSGTTPEGWAVITVAGLVDPTGRRLVASVVVTAPRVVLTVRLEGIGRAP